MARNRLDDELSIVKRVQLFREHNALLKALKDVVDPEKIRKEAKYMILNYDMPLNEIYNTSQSSHSDTEKQKFTLKKSIPINIVQDVNFKEEQKGGIKVPSTSRGELNKPQDKVDKDHDHTNMTFGQLSEVFEEYKVSKEITSYGMN